MSYVLNSYLLVYLNDRMEKLSRHVPQGKPGM